MRVVEDAEGEAVVQGEGLHPLRAHRGHVHRHLAEVYKRIEKQSTLGFRVYDVGTRLHMVYQQPLYAALYK